MGWFIHHVNLQAHDVPQAAAFYRDIIGLVPGEWAYPERPGLVGHGPETLAYFGAGNRGLHIVRAIGSFPRDNNLDHNPTIGGHFAVAVPDVLGVKARLEEAGTLVSDAGVYAMAGMYQIYCYDPWFNVVEVNQVVDAAGGEAAAPGEAHGVHVQPGGWHIHHVGLPVHEVSRSIAFLELIGCADADAVRDTGAADGSPDRAAVGGDGRGIRLARPRPTFAREHGLIHNPTADTYVSLCVGDLAEVVGRLDAAGIPYSGDTDAEGARLVYVCDPSMNLVEVRQTADAESPPAHP